MLKKKQNADHLWTDIETSKKKIVDAAIACFEKFGPQKTNMGDIAKAAGISRPTLYRVFEDRPSLVEAVITLRIADRRQNPKSRDSLQPWTIRNQVQTWVTSPALQRRLGQDAQCPTLVVD